MATYMPNVPSNDLTRETQYKFTPSTNMGTGRPTTGQLWPRIKR